MHANTTPSRPRTKRSKRPIARNNPLPGDGTNAGLGGRSRSSLGSCLAVCLAALLAQHAAAAPVVSTAVHRLDYTTLDYDNQVQMPLDIDGDGQEEFTFSILNSDDDHYLGAVDFTRNHGFVGDFDDEDEFIFRVFQPGDLAGPELEDDLGFEVFNYGEYEFSRNTPFAYAGGGLAGSTVYVVFGFYAVDFGPSGDDEGTRYGWMRLTFGDLVATGAAAPSNCFIEIDRVGYASELGERVVVGACNAADLAAPVFLLDLADIVAFVNAFTASDPLADLDGNSLFDLADLSAFVTAFAAGCP